MILHFSCNTKDSCGRKEEKIFSFVQLCDTQLGRGGYEHDIETFKQAVVQINELNPDFVIICGDLVDNANDSSYSDFININKKFKVPCHLAPGNHDVANIPTNTTLNYYRKTIGKDYYDFQNKNHSFIITNTQLWKSNIESESEKHNKWFEQILHEKKKQQVSNFCYRTLSIIY